MNKLVLTVLVVVALAGAGYGLYVWQPWAEPEKQDDPLAAMHEGKRLDAWAEDLRSWDRRRQIEAMRALGRAGSKAQPVQGALAVRLNNDDLSDAELREALIDALSLIGASTIDPILEQVQAAPSEHLLLVRQTATLALARLGPAAIPALAKAAKQRGGEAGKACIFALGRIGSDSIPVLIGLLADSGTARAGDDAAAAALARIAPADVTPLLRAALSTSTERMRRRLLQTLQRLGPHAADAAPDLVPLLKDPDESTRLTALQILGSFERSTAIPVELLIAYVDGADANARYYAMLALRAMGPAAKQAIPALANVVKTPPPREPSFQARDHGLIAAETLAAIGTDEAALLELLDDASPVTRDRAALALAHFHTEKGELLSERLLQRTAGRSPRVRAGVLFVVGELGQPTKEVKTAVVAGLRDEDVGVRAAAAFAHCRLGLNDPESRAVFLKLIEEQDTRAAVCGMYALAASGPLDETIGRALLGCLRHKERSVRLVAIEFLSQGGWKDAELATALAALARDRQDTGPLVALQRRQALMGLGRLGPVAGDALVSVLADLEQIEREPEMFAALCEAAARVQPNNKLLRDKALAIVSQDALRPRVRGPAALFLLHGGEQESAVLRAIDTYLSEDHGPDPTGLVSTYQSLGGTGERGRAVVPLLTRKAQAPALTAYNRDLALAFSTPRFVRRALGAGERLEFNQQVEAVLALGRLGPVARDAAPDLIRVWRLHAPADDDTKAEAQRKADVRQAIVAALREINPARKLPTLSGDFDEELERLAGSWKSRGEAKVRLSVDFEVKRGPDGLTPTVAGITAESERKAIAVYEVVRTSTGHAIEWNKQAADALGLPVRVSYRFQGGDLIMNVAEGAHKGEQRLRRVR
jgi:hypothetical protein